MTPKEFRKARQELQASIGSDAFLSVTVTDLFWEAKASLLCTVYPFGLMRDAAFAVDADDFAELLEKTKAKWVEHEATFAQQTIRKMALAIIRHTADYGQCTDAALRQEFNAAEVERYSAAACIDANEIAGKGPFEIVVLPGPNGGPDHVERPQGATVN